MSLFGPLLTGLDKKKEEEEKKQKGTGKLIRPVEPTISAIAPPPSLAPKPPVYTPPQTTPTMEDWEKELTNQAVIAETQQKAIAETDKQLQAILELEEGPKDAVPWFRTLLSLFDPVYGALRTRQNEEEYIAQTAELRQQLTTQMEEFEATEDRILGLSAMLASRAATFDEFLGGLVDKEGRLIAPDIHPDNIQYLRDWWTRAQAGAPVIPERPGPVSGIDKQSIAESLTQKPAPTPVSLDIATTEEIVKSLRAPALPSLPAGLTAAEIEEIFGYTDIDEFLDDNTKELIEQWSDLKANIAAIKAGLAEPEIPPLSFFELVKMIITQPALAAFDAVQVYSDYWSKPWSGMIMAHAPGGKFGRQKDEFQRLIDQARADGKSHWMSYGAVHDESVTSWGESLTAEILFDPITYLGFGWVSKVTKPIPLVGRFISGINDTWIRIWDEAFIGILSVFKKIPKTPSQKAGEFANKAKQSMRGAIVHATGERNAARWTAEQIRKVAKDGREFSARFPDMAATSDLAQFGKYQMSARFIEPDDLKDIVAKLGVDTPTQQQLVDINYRYERVKLPGGKGVFTAREGGQEILGILNATTNDENIKLATKFIDDRMAMEIKLAENIFAGDEPAKMMKAFGSHVHDSMETMLKSPNYRFQQKMGAATAIAGKVEGFIKNPVMAGLQEQFVTPLARMYLLFANLGPFNTVESFIKGGMRGLDLISPMGKTTNPVKLAQWTFADMPNAPVDIMDAVARTEMWITTPIGESALRPVGDLKTIEKLTPPGIFRPLPFKKIPAKFRSALDWHEYWGELGLKTRSWYMLLQNQRELAKLAPEQMAKIKKLTSNMKGLNLKSMTKAEVDDLMEYIPYAASVGPDALRSLKQAPSELYKSRVARAADELLSQHVNIDDAFKETIKHRVVEGNALKNAQSIDTLMNEITGGFKDSEIFKGFWAADNYEAIAKDFVKMKPQNYEQLAGWMNSMQDMVNTNSQTIHDLRKLVTRRGEEIKSVAGKDDFHTAAHERLMRYMDKTETSITEMIQHLRNQIDELAPENADALKGLLDIWDQETKAVRASRELARDIWERNVAALGGKSRTSAGDAFWKGVYKDWAEMWDGYDEVVKGLRKDQFSFVKKAGLDSAPIPKPPTVIGDLTPAHVAYISGVTDSGLVQSMLRGETHMLQSKFDFVADMSARAEIVAGNVGKTATDIGFSDDAIGAVYDRILRSMGVNPNNPIPELTPKFLELDSIRNGLQKMRQSVGLDAGDAEKINSFIDDLANRVSRPAHEVSEGVTGTPIDVFRKGAERGDPSRGTFYYIGKKPSKGVDYIGRKMPADFEYNIQTTVRPNNVLRVPKSELISDVSSEALATKWFPDTDFRVSGVLDEAAVLKMDKAVAAEAMRRGYDAIQYGDDVLQMLDLGVSPTVYDEGLIPLSTRTKAMEEARRLYEIDFANYTDNNVGDAIMRSIFPFWCVPEHATILTKSGWKHHSQLTVGEEVLTLNTDTMESNWEHVQKVETFEYDDELMVIPSKGKDIEFTPNHRWPVVNEWSKDTKIKMGYELKEVSDLLPRAVPHNFSEDSVLNPREAAILGWVVTDGYIRYDEGRKPQMFVYQHKDKYIDSICAATGTEAYPRSIASDPDNMVIRVSQEDTDHILSICPDKDHLLGIIPQLSEDAAYEMWEAMAMAEGNWDRAYNGKQFFRFLQQPGPVSQAFQMLSVLLGRAITVGSRGDLDMVYICNNRKPYQAKQVRRLTTKHYKGKVWCPVTPSGTWLINCNGSVLWTGNTYEAHRWQWLPRNFLQKPALFTGWGRYMDYTDDGYMTLPGTDIQINPLRGTIFMGGFRRFYMKDFPEYYDRFPEFSNFWDYLGRAGFYPGPHINLPMLILGANANRRPEFGEIMPAWIKTPLNAYMAAFPESKAAKLLSEALIPDRFRDFYISLELNKMGEDGDYLLAKRQEGDKLTVEEQAAWDEALRTISAFNAVNEQFGLFRFRPNEMREAYERAAEITEEITGINKETQEWVRRHSGITGKNMSNYYPLDPTQQAMLYETSGIENWANMAYPLLPSSQQEEIRKIVTYYKEIEMVREKAETTGIGGIPSFNELDNQFITYLKGEPGGLEGGQWLKWTGDLMGEIRNTATVLGNSTHYADVPLTMEERIDHYKKWRNTEPVFHPAKELLWYYYEQEPEVINKNHPDYDPDIGLTRNWDKYFGTVDSVINALPDAERSQFIAMIQKNWTPMYKLWWAVNRQYVRPYKNIKKILLEGYTPEEQKLIKEFEIAPPVRREELKAIQKDGESLVSSFAADVRQARANLRMLDPRLDAWLRIFGITSVVKTEAAEKMYQHLVDSIISGTYDTEPLQ